jgi:hypothetical protein
MFGKIMQRFRGTPSAQIAVGLGHIVTVEVFRNGKRIFLERGHNLITNAGINWLADLMGNAAGSPAAYIALSPTQITPDVGDTSLSGEYTGDTSGFKRAGATYAHTTNALTYTLAKTFTCAGTNTGAWSTALFIGVTGGSPIAEYVFANQVPTLVADDQIVVTWTGTLSRT